MISLLFITILTIHLLSLWTKAFRVCSFSHGKVRYGSMMLTRVFQRQSCLSLRKRVWILSSKGSDPIDPLLLSDSIFERLFEDILYSGDVEAVYRRNPRIFLNPKFFSFLTEKLKSLDEEDEKTVIEGVLGMIEHQVQLSDGMGQGSDVLYERRLDKIVYTNPSERKQVLKELEEELSPGFISFLQNEMKSSKDLDVKVVVAEILHEISELQGGEYLNSEEKELVVRGVADRSAKSVREVSDQLEQLSKLGGRNEQILAGLLFSNKDIVEDIFNNIHLLDAEFLSFLQKKIQSTSNIEERSALTSLLQSIKQVSGKVQELEAERLLESVDQGEDLSFDAVKERMRAVQAGPSGSSNSPIGSKADKATQEDLFSVKATKSETFWSIIQRFEDMVVHSAGNLTLIDVIKANYALCDYEFIRLLETEASAAKEKGNIDLSRRLLDIKRGINEVMVVEMEIAQGKLANILSKRDPKAIEAEVIRMARRGEVNEALILLIEGNIQAARQENAQGAVLLLSKLLQRISEEKERKMPDDQRLLRHLLKVSSSEKRKEVLFNAFKPSKKLNDKTGEFETNGPPEVAPPVFIDLVRKFITEFGNVDSFNIMSVANEIIDEAQEVATDLFGPGMTPQEQQRMMFEKNTVSVWDLANLEEHSMLSGEEVPWSNDNYNDKDVEDVLGERVRKIGGAEADL